MFETGSLGEININNWQAGPNASGGFPVSTLHPARVALQLQVSAKLSFYGLRQHFILGAVVSRQRALFGPALLTPVNRLNIFSGLPENFK